MESPIQSANTQPTSKIENIEREPKVEHLFFSDNKSVLIKTSFPWRDAIAYSYILILEPTQITFDELQKDLTSKHYQDGMTKEVEYTTRRAFEDMNRPVIFNGIEGAQEWFDISSFQDAEEKRRVANFLGVESKGR